MVHVSVWGRGIIVSLGANSILLKNLSHFCDRNHGWGIKAACAFFRFAPIPRFFCFVGSFIKLVKCLNFAQGDGCSACCMYDKLMDAMDKIEGHPPTTQSVSKD